MNDSNYTMFGYEEQKNIQDLSDTLFNSMKNDPKEGILRIITDMCTYLEYLQTTATYVKDKPKSLKNAYSDANKRMDFVSEGLKDYQITLLKSLQMYDAYENMNRTYINKLRTQINKGKQLLASLDTNIFESRQDYELLSARIDDMHTTEQVSAQLSVQIHMMLNEQKALLSGITEILNNTIKFWKEQVIIKLESTQGLPNLKKENQKLLDQFKNILKITK